MTEPRLSIIVLTFDRAPMLKGCLQTLFEQSVPREELEVIVVDDGSSDDTPALVKAQSQNHSELRYVRQPHRGIPAARNLGIRTARAPLVAIVADDYLLAPDYAETILRFFEAHAEAAVVRFKIVASRDDLSSRLSHLYFQISIMNRLTPRPRGMGNPPNAVASLCGDGILCDHELEAAGAAAFRREVLERVGPFDETLQRAEDTDFTRRLRALGFSVCYDPSHEVKHQYLSGCADTLSKCFQTGYNRYFLHRKYLDQISAPRFFREFLRRVTSQVSRSWRHARRIVPGWSLALYIPGLMLFETMVKAGLVWGLASALWRRRAADAPPNQAPE